MWGKEGKREAERNSKIPSQTAEEKQSFSNNWVFDSVTEMRWEVGKLSGWNLGYSANQSDFG